MYTTTTCTYTHGPHLRHTPHTGNNKPRSRERGKKFVRNKKQKQKQKPKLRACETTGTNYALSSSQTTTSGGAITRSMASDPPKWRRSRLSSARGTLFPASLEDQKKKTQTRTGAEEEEGGDVGCAAVTMLRRRQQTTP